MTIPQAAEANDLITGRIGIATVLFNSGEVLPDFLESLLAQTHRDYRVFAVDNASGDGSAELCATGGDRFTVIRHAENTGFAHATNEGIRRALADRCEIVLILNNDVVFPPEFLQTLLEGLRRTGADIVAPLTFYHDRPNVIWAAGGSLQAWFGYRPTHLGMEQTDTGQFAADKPIQFAPGSCIFARRSVFAAIGLLDETYFTYWEDTDFAVRALRAGLRTFLIPQAKLWHKVSSLVGMRSAFQIHYATRNHAIYLRKHCGALIASAFSALYLAWYGVASLRRGRLDTRIRSWNEGLQIARKQGY